MTLLLETADGGRLRVPASWDGVIADGPVAPRSIGKSAADVFRVRRAGRALFLKCEPLGPFCELPGEAARLRWLAGRGPPAPTIVDEIGEDDRHWLLTSALPGRDLANAGDLPPSGIVAIVAAALRALHRLPVALCPFDHRIEPRIAAAEARMDAGLVDETDFDAARAGRTARDLLAELRSTRPGTEDCVVTHGDACLPNLVADGTCFTGFVDCGRLGVADRHQDLALAARSVADNLGPEWTALFFRHYGIEPDQRRLAFYRLLDEFF